MPYQQCIPFLVSYKFYVSLLILIDIHYFGIILAYNFLDLSSYLGGFFIILSIWFHLRYKLAWFRSLKNLDDRILQNQDALKKVHRQITWSIHSSGLLVILLVFFCLVIERAIFIVSCCSCCCIFCVLNILHGFRTRMMYYYFGNTLYQPLIENENNNNACSICLDLLMNPNDSHDNNHDAVQILCSHTFHKNCIQVWFLKSLSCPLCRRDASILSAKDFKKHNEES